MTGRIEGKDAWKTLLRSALRLVDGLPAAGYGTLDFRLGGGTVLMFAFGHRISRDIDIFFDDAQALGFLSPRLNRDAARLAAEYQENANSVKLILPGGDIDFIVAGRVVRREPDATLAFEGRDVPLDPVAEILAKKLLYRPASLRARDLFDLAVALERDHAAALEAIAATASVHDVLLRRLRELEAGWPDTRDPPGDILAAAVPPVSTMVAAVRSAIERTGREEAR